MINDVCIGEQLPVAKVNVTFDVVASHLWGETPVRKAVHSNTRLIIVFLTMITVIIIRKASLGVITTITTTTTLKHHWI